MTGPTQPSGDPRLIWAVWADESTKAAGNDEPANARRHRDQDRQAAMARASGKRRPGLLRRLGRLFRLSP